MPKVGCLVQSSLLLDFLLYLPLSATVIGASFNKYHILAHDASPPRNVVSCPFSHFFLSGTIFSLPCNTICTRRFLITSPTCNCSNSFVSPRTNVLRFVLVLFAIEVDGERQFTFSLGPLMSESVIPRFWACSRECVVCLHGATQLKVWSQMYPRI
jgi:hypothetical protein